MRFTLILTFSISLFAQDPRFDAHARLVLVPASVTDANGRFVDGLEAPDFQVLDNGRPQNATVDTIGTGVAPIALVIAVQSSGISSAVLEKVRKIGVMIQPLITGERGCTAVVSFDERVAWQQHCTGDPDAIERAFEQIRPRAQKEARMLDAAQAAIEHLRSRPNARRILLLISESRDRGSETDLNAVIISAQSAGVTVYAATYSAMKTAFTSKSQPSDPPRLTRPKTPNDNMGTVDGNPPSKYNRKMTPPDQSVDVIGAIGELTRLGKTNTTQALTVGTGGATLPFTRQKGLEDTIAKLGAELHAQYVLSFAPDSSAPGYHNLEVRVVRRGEVRIRARPGYWSAERASSAPPPD